MSLDIVDSNILKQPPTVQKKKHLKKIYKISFDNKTFKKVNLPRIFHDPLVKTALPNTSTDF